MFSREGELHGLPLVVRTSAGLDHADGVLGVPLYAAGLVGELEP
ncbi:hypothetical protein [Enorma phocaeensis]